MVSDWLIDLHTLCYYLCCFLRRFSDLEESFNAACRLYWAVSRLYWAVRRLYWAVSRLY